MRFVLADKNLVVAERVYEGFPLLIGDDGYAIQPAQEFLWHLITRSGRIASKKTWDTYGRSIYDFFAFAITNKYDWRSPPVNGMPAAVEAWRDWSKGTLGLTARTINQRIRVVVRFYQWALRKGLIDTVPFDYVTVQIIREPGFLHHVDERGGKVAAPEVMLTEPKQTIRILTRDHILACHEATNNLTHRLLFEVMVRTGMRQMEARTFPDAYVFDPSGRRDLKPSQKIRVHLDPREMEIKFGKPRDIDVPYDLMEKLWAYTVRWRQRRANNQPDGMEYPHLFLTEGGQPYTKDAVTAIFRTMSKRVGFKVEAHMLRHSYATYLLWSLRKSTSFQGEPLLYVRDRMGHSDVSTTTIYLHLINSLEGHLVLAHEDEIDQLFSPTIEAAVA
jgi:site-specific recombinase XerD